MGAQRISGWHLFAEAQHLFGLGRRLGETAGDVEGFGRYDARFDRRQPVRIVGRAVAGLGGRASDR